MFKTKTKRISHEDTKGTKKSNLNAPRTEGAEDREDAERKTETRSNKIS